MIKVLFIKYSSINYSERTFYKRQLYFFLDLSINQYNHNSKMLNLTVFQMPKYKIFLLILTHISSHSLNLFGYLHDYHYDASLLHIYFVIALTHCTYVTLLSNKRYFSKY